MFATIRCGVSKSLPVLAYHRGIRTTSSLSLNQKWRRKAALPTNPNEFGPLTNLPDYTFMDGRPTPMGMNLMRRLERQKTAAKEMVEKISELNFAKERFANIQKEKNEFRERVLGMKLKPKGPLLLKK